MDERKELILHAIIQDYVKSSEPVASRTIARKYNLGISPATVRNEMYDLEEEGYLEQLHTSSGRIPSAKGYRFYVDSLLKSDYIAPEDAELLRSLWQQRPADFHEFFFRTAKAISRLSHNIAMVLAPSRDSAAIRFIHILPAGEYGAIMVVVTDTGALDNEPISFVEAVTEVELERAAQHLTELLRGKLLRDIDGAAVLTWLTVTEGDSPFWQALGAAFERILSKRKLFCAVGMPELLSQPEFKDVETVQPVFHFLEREDQLTRLLTNDSGQPLTIRIGRENRETSIQNCSLIQADFSAGDEALGTVAILGPIRMEYARIIGMLQYMQDFFNDLQKRDEE